MKRKLKLARFGSSKILNFSTEDLNRETENLDRVPVKEAVRLFIQEDRRVFDAMGEVAGAIVKAVDIVVKGFRNGGRLIYLGAGTSGRLGFIDAAECPPTFGVEPGMVVALMAGGEKAFRKAVEGSEDDENGAIRDLKKIRVESKDVVFGITASGTTPYVRSGLDHAKSIGCDTILLACNPVRRKSGIDVIITPLVGPEVISGSTRLKSGTACKMILNMISSISMIKLGKVYKNLMVDVVATNRKLIRRARRIVMLGAGVSEEEAENFLESAGGEAKTAIYLARRGGSPTQARKAIKKAGGSLAQALGEIGLVVDGG